MSSDKGVIGVKILDSNGKHRVSNSTSIGNFFAVDRQCWAKACEDGMNDAVAYLVLARGTGRDQRTTSWSVNAVEKYTGISRGRAKTAIDRLQTSGLFRALRKGSHPRYEIQPWSEVIAPGIKLSPAQIALIETVSAGDQPTSRQAYTVDTLVNRGVLKRNAGGTVELRSPEWIWLPNEFVTGAADEIPPLELLRQTQDVMALRLCVDLYFSQNLVEDGGISRRIASFAYDRFEIGHQGQYDIWGFKRGLMHVSWNETTLPHKRDESDLTKEERDAGENEGIDFFRRTNLLTDISLVELIPHLVESDDDDAELIHPVWIENLDSESLESRLGLAAHKAGAAMLTKPQRSWAASKGLFLVPVPRHFTRVQVIGIARLRYRPKTRLTSAWWADRQTSGEGWVRRYSELVTSTAGAAASL